MNTGIAIYQPQSLEELRGLGRIFAQSKLFSDLTDEARAVVKIMAGAEFGMGPFASVNGIHIIQGKPVIGANLMANAIKRSGRYNYRIEYLENDGCKIRFFERIDGKWQECGVSSFMKEDAIAAGLLAKENWKKNPRNMYFARAISNGMRWYAPDALGTAVYTPDEFDLQVSEDGEVVLEHAQADQHAGTQHGVTDPELGAVDNQAQEHDEVASARLSGPAPEPPPMWRWVLDPPSVGKFFAWAEKQGVSHAEALTALGVDEIEQYGGDKAAARDAINAYVAQRDM